MTREESEEYAKNMTYRDAINNLMKARSIPYRKATFIKVNELLKALEQEPKTGHWIAVVDKWGDIVTTVSGYKCSECGEFDGFRDKYCPNCGAKMVEQERGDKE